MKIIEKMKGMLNRKWEVTCPYCGYSHHSNAKCCPECGKARGTYTGLGDVTMKLELEFDERLIWRLDNLIKNGKYTDRESAIVDAVKRLISARR
jgi:primosomal protein N'